MALDYNRHAFVFFRLICGRGFFIRLRLLGLVIFFARVFCIFFWSFCAGSRFRFGSY
jgi:hypothetical protein